MCLNTPFGQNEDAFIFLYLAICTHEFENCEKMFTPMFDQCIKTL